VTAVDTDLDTDTDTATRLADRLFEGTVAALELYSVYLGTELGLYRVLAEHGPMTYPELGERAGIAPRYAVEWLEQQAVAGLVEVEDAAADAPDRRYHLDPAHRAVLVDADDPLHVAPFAHLLAGIGGVLPKVVEAYRTGAGVPYAEYGPAFRHGQGHINRPACTHELATDWLAALPDVVARLHTAPQPRIADLGCGQGWSTRALARAFPRARVDGYDIDPGSIADAARQIREAGLAGQVRLLQAEAGRLVEEGPYDLVLVVEALHDMAQPADVLRSARAALAPGGAVLVVDERVADRFTAPGTPVERMMYGWSVTHCLPSQLVEPGAAAIGTVLRADTVRALAAEAGFTGCTVLPVDNDVFRLYRLDG
jgi:SAM-dependent methyltransferase